LVEERQSSATDAAHSRGRGVSRGATPAADAAAARSGAAAQRRSGAAEQRSSGAAEQRSSGAAEGAHALTTPPSNRSSRSKLTFALVRVSCEIQRSERARLLVTPGKARRPLPPLLFAVACSNTTDGGTADLARVLRLAPADARFWAYCRAASRAVVDFSLSTGGKEGENRPVVCLIPG
jgi:hypothetical protein